MHTWLKQSRFQLLLIILLTSLAYINIFQNSFAADDTDFITNWETIRHFENIPKVLTTETSHPQHPGVYRPLRTLFLLLEYQSFKLNPFGYHVVSLVVHLLSTVLIFFITKEILQNKSIMYHVLRIKRKKQNSKSIIHNTYYIIPFITALLFGLHPIHTESITFILNSIDTIGAVFFLGAFLLYIKATQKPHTINSTQFILSVTLATLAFFTYELCLTLPLLIVSYDLLIRKHKLSQRLKFYAPYFVSLAFYLFVRFYVFGITTRGQYIAENLYFNFLLMSKIFIVYLSLLIFPLNLSLNHQILDGIFALSDKATINPQTLNSLTILNPQLLFGLLIIFTLIFIAIKYYNKLPIISFAIFWFFITLLPVANLLPQGELMAERYLYLPSFGFILILALGLIWVSKFLEEKTFLKKNYDFLLVILVVIISSLYLYRTYLRNKDWKDNITVWKVLAAQNPQDFKAQFNLADLYVNQGDYKNALIYFKKAELLSSNLPYSIVEYDSKLGVSFYYQKGWQITESDNLILIKSPLNNLDAIISVDEIANDQSFEQYLQNQNDQNGKLLQEGLAKIPNFDSAYVKIWDDSGIQKLQFFLFKDEKIIKVLVSPASSENMKEFDKILGSLKTTY